MEINWLLHEDPKKFTLSANMPRQGGIIIWKSVGTSEHEILAMEHFWPDRSLPFSDLVTRIRAAFGKGVSPDAVKNLQSEGEGSREVVGYVSLGTIEYLRQGKGKLACSNIYRYSDDAWPTPLYSRPANVLALEADRDRWKQQAQYETDVAEAAIQKGKEMEARMKELEAEKWKDQEVIRWLAGKLASADPEMTADCDLLANAALDQEERG